MMRRLDFNDCFVAGEVRNVRRGKEFNGDISSVRGDLGFKDMLTEGLDVSDTHLWLVVHYRKDEPVEASACDILIGEVAGVYALDMEGRKKIVESADKRIHVKAPIWSDSYDMLTLVRWADIEDLDKNGRMSVPRGSVFCGDENAHDAREEVKGLLRGKFIMSHNEWVIVHYRKKGWDGKEFCEVRKEEVYKRYSLNGEASAYISKTYKEDYPFPWPEEYAEQQLEQNIRMTKRGIESIWKVFGLEKADLERCRQFFNEDYLIREVCTEVLDGQRRPEGSLPVWVYALRYQRHEPYYRDNRGSFQDALHVLMNAAVKKENNEGMQGNALGMKELSLADEKSRYDELWRLPVWEYIKKSARSKEVEVPEKYFQIAPLFFILSGQFRGDGIDVNGCIDGRPFKSFVSSCKNYEVFPEAAYLLGVLLSNRKTYDALYDTVGPDFFYKSKACLARPQQTQTLQSRGNDGGAGLKEKKSKPTSSTLTNRGKGGLSDSPSLSNLG